ncbi:MAG: redoxin domain-containing protein [Acidobacteriota bacterium]
MNRRTPALKALATFAAINALGLALLHCRPALAELAVGAPAPEFSLQDVDGKTRTLAELRGKIVVLEWINPNCPFSRRHATEKTMVSTEHRHPDVVWLGINSTRKGHSDHIEPAEQKKYDADKGIDYDVLFDPAGSTGKAYGAKTTPHMFVVDEQGKVLYNGAIDDDPSGRKNLAERVNFVDKALAAHQAGQAVDPASTQPYGCSVKY